MEKKNPKGRSLYLEFSVAISGIVVIFVTLTISFNLQRERKLLEENREMRISGLLATFGKLAAKASTKTDLQFIFRAAGEATSDPEVAYFILHDADGKCILSTKAALQDQRPHDRITGAALVSKVPMLTQSYVDPESKTPMLDLSAPVMSGDKRIGTIRFGLNCTHYNARLSQMRYENAGLSFVSVLMAMLVSFVLARRTMEPIRLLKRKLDALVQGETIEQVTIESAEEIQQLAASFNAMTAKWQQLYEELRKAYEELKTLDEMKDRFVALVSHELRTPLSSIIAAGELLSEHRNLSPAETREFVGIINTEGKRLTKLVTDILDLAKMKAGKDSYHYEMRSLNDPVAQAATLAEFAAETKKQRLTVRLGENLPPVRIDFDRMVQVVSNLLNNAVKYTQEGGEITATTSADDHGVLLAVKDNGTGIAPEDRGRIFKEFEQAGDMNAHVSGTGLGLAICKRLVEMGHDGKIWVESEGKGKGSTFFVRLPLAPPETVAKDEPPLNT